MKSIKREIKKMISNNTNNAKKTIGNSSTK